MGSVFGKHGVEEPAYDVLLKSSGNNNIPYEIRKYGPRMAAETKYECDVGSTKRDNSFMTLAKYIGVFGKPENEGSQNMAMTAPVAMKKDEKEVKEKKGQKIAMTAPVTMSGNKSSSRTMTFMLPSEYKTMDSVPKPTNPNVIIKELPVATGAVHRYSWYLNDGTARDKALALGKQLRDDAEGISTDLTDDFILQHYESWGYDPPFTLPMFRRNEVWIELTDTQVEHLLSQQQQDGNSSSPKN